MLNIPQNSNWLEEQAKVSQDELAIVTGHTELTYSALLKSVSERTQVISNQIKKNDIIGIEAEHSEQFIIDLLAVWSLGAAVLPLSPNLSYAEKSAQINAFGFKVLNDLLNEDANLARRNPASDQSALIMFTSGTTGKQKAVKHTFESLYSSANSINEIFNFLKKEIWLASLPFYRIGGFQIIVRALLSGGTICIPEEIKTEAISQSLQSFQPDYLSLVNASLKELLNTNKNELQKCKAVFVGGGPVNSRLILESIENKITLYKVYGSTETGSMVSILIPEDALNKSDSAGKPLPGVDLKIVDDEVFVASHSLFSGYINNEVLTKAKISDGWFATGDEGFIDKDGFLFIKSRKDNLIISGGEKIDPEEIKNELENLNQIEQAFVFGVPDQKWGEKICAAVAVTTRVNIEELKDKLKEILPSYKIPKAIKVVEKIPQDEMGKVNFTELKKLFE